MFIAAKIPNVFDKIIHTILVLVYETMSSESVKLIVRLSSQIANNYRYRYCKIVSDKANFRLLTCIITFNTHTKHMCLNYFKLYAQPL